MNELKRFETGESIYDEEFREKLNALVDYANDSGKALMQQGILGGPRIDRDKYGIPVRLTAHSSSFNGQFEFEEVWTQTDGKTWTVKTGGLTHTELGEARARGMWAGGAGGVRFPFVGRIVYLRPAPASVSGERLYEFDPPTPVVFPITASQTGGGSGSFSAKCSYTYTIKDVDGTNIATGVDPEASPHVYVRPSKGSLSAGTAGIAYYGTDGSNNPELRILYLNEAPNYDYEECS